MKSNILKLCRISAVGISSWAIVGCSVAGPVADEFNPFASDPGVTYGERSNSAILEASGGGGKGAEEARHALEAMASYRRAHAPQPAYPVIRPAEVRLMWIPDHLTTDGNLVPAHYYYLKVMNDDWEVQDAFEIEGQLEGGGRSGQDYGSAGGASSSATPWVYKQGR
jgi:hypothetical protein